MEREFGVLQLGEVFCARLEGVFVHIAEGEALHVGLFEDVGQVVPSHVSATHEGNVDSVAWWQKSVRCTDNVRHRQPGSYCDGRLP